MELKCGTEERLNLLLWLNERNKLFLGTIPEIRRVHSLSPNATKLIFLTGGGGGDVGRDVGLFVGLAVGIFVGVRVVGLAEGFFVGVWCY